MINFESNYWLNYSPGLDVSLQTVVPVSKAMSEKIDKRKVEGRFHLSRNIHTKADHVSLFETSVEYIYPLAIFGVSFTIPFS